MNRFPADEAEPVMLDFVGPLRATPDFRFTEQEAKAIRAYLYSIQR
jgi:hypothetical protein